MLSISFSWKVSKVWDKWSYNNAKDSLEWIEEWVSTNKIGGLLFLQKDTSNSLDRIIILLKRILKYLKQISFGEFEYDIQNPQSPNNKHLPPQWQLPLLQRSSIISNNSIHQVLIWCLPRKDLQRYQTHQQSRMLLRI